MTSKFFYFVLIIFALCLISVRSRPLANLNSLQNKLSTNEGNMSNKGQGEVKETEEYTDMNKEEKKMIGSSPPSCEHKCYGCMPCEAIQVPTNTGRVGVQYTNYEPEGWRCKCGPAFYTP